MTPRRHKAYRPNGCVSPNEAGRLLGVSGEAVKYHIRAGRLRAAKARNGYWWIRLEDLDSFREGEHEELVFKIHGPVGSPCTERDSNRNGDRPAEAKAWAELSKLLESSAHQEISHSARTKR